MSALAGKGYIGVGAGVTRPVKDASLCPDDGTHNNLYASPRWPVQRADAMLRHFKAVQRATLDPSVFTHIAATALVISTLSKRHQGERLNVTG